MSSIDKGHAGLSEHCGEGKGVIMTYSRPCYTPQHRTDLKGLPRGRA